MKINTVIRNAFVIALLLGGAGCGGYSGVATVSIDDPSNGFSTVATSIKVSGSAISGSYPSGLVFWNNGSYNGYASVSCDTACDLITSIGSWEATIPLNVGSNTITATFDGAGDSVIRASDSIVVTRIPVFTVSGKVYMQGTNAPLMSPDVTVTRTDPANSTLLAANLDSSGTYSFAGLLAGNYTISPYLPAPASSSCLTFTPTSQTISLSTTDMTVQDFSAITSSPCYSIQGQITHLGNGVSNISVYIQDASGTSSYRTTNSSGVYQFNYLAQGTYTITPQPCTGCITFSPASFTVTIVNADVTGQDSIE